MAAPLRRTHQPARSAHEMPVKPAVRKRLEAQGFWQRHFVFIVATVWLIATGWAFHLGAEVAGIALGVPLILVGALASITNFCIPSFIYNTMARRRSREGV